MFYLQVSGFRDGIKTFMINRENCHVGNAGLCKLDEAQIIRAAENNLALIILSLPFLL